MQSRIRANTESTSTHEHFKHFHKQTHIPGLLAALKRGESSQEEDVVGVDLIAESSSEHVAIAVGQDRQRGCDLKR